MQMTAAEVAALVRSQIGDAWSQTNAHGVDLRSCLVAPRRIQAMFEIVRDGRVKAKPRDVWLILEELPVAQNGYKIVFDEERQAFALATPGFPEEERPGIVGYYDDFWAAFLGM